MANVANDNVPADVRGKLTNHERLLWRQAELHIMLNELRYPSLVNLGRGMTVD
jgi:hypothetical protein